MNEDIGKYLASMDLKWIKDLRRQFIAGIILVIASFAFYKFIFIKHKADIAVADTEIRNLASEMSRAGFEAEAIERLKKEIERSAQNQRDIDQRLLSLKERLPSDKRISRIISELSRAESPDGLRIVSIKPLQPEDKGEVTRIPLHVVVESGFIPFGRYMERIEGLQRITVVENFMIEPRDETGAVLSSQMYLSSYILNIAK
jgi:type IV pilus assembly protein PilO